MTEFLTFGELLIDFTPAGEQDGRKLFMQNAGGAPANVAAAMAGFDISAGYMGMVGNDAFGHYLADVLQSKNVDITGLKFSDSYNTTLAFVHLFPDGDRDFSFYRKPGADIMFSADMLDEAAIRGARVFHVGSLSLTDEPARSATLRALDIAREAGVVISYDPNYRPPLWSDEETARKWMLEGLAYADILKISDNEVDFLFGNMPYEDAAKMLIDRGAKLVFVTMGSAGAVYACAAGTGKAEPFPAKAVDATGAGDCFTAGAVSRFIASGKELETLTLGEVGEFACFGNAAASLCVERKGGIPSMPTLEQVMRRLEEK